jgi:hypothetical protein
MNDFPALITFYEGWADTGTISEDGFPVYVDTTMINIERPPLLKLQRVATREDMATYHDEYNSFLDIKKAKRNTGDEGYPLVYWPAATAAEVQTLAARQIGTVEKLAELANARDLPPQLLELARRAERMLDMQKNFGKYEAILSEREAEIGVLKEQVKDVSHSLAAANAIIETLKLKVA